MAKRPDAPNVGRSELVSTGDIARRLGVSPTYIRRLNAAGAMPAPIGVLGNRPVWRWAPVRVWAERNGRLEK